MTTTRFTLGLTLGCCLLLTGGCALTESEYRRPEATLPAAWQYGEKAAGPAEARKTAPSPWWKKFHDPALNALIDEALAKNNDLAAAALKVKAARLEANLAVDQQLPDLSAEGTASNSRGLRRDGTIARSYAATLSASYELDLWGKIARQADASAWEAAATEADRDSAQVTLIGTVATLYWKIAYLNERVALSQQSVDYLGKTLALVRARHAAGLDSALDEASAEQSLAAQEAAHTQYVQQRVEARTAFALLFDAPPETDKANPGALPRAALPELSAGTPATLLARRPDLRAAEHRLRESLADVDATRTSYLPTFSLTGSLGSSSTALSRVLTDPVGTLGAGVVLPFLDWFDMKNNIAVSETDYERAVVEFRQSLYAALADVENALSARTQDAAQGAKLAQAALKAREAEDLYAARYQEGYAPLQDWLDAQEKRRTAEASALENRYTQLTDCIALYEALGGDAE